MRTTSSTIVRPIDLADLGTGERLRVVLRRNAARSASFGHFEGSSRDEFSMPPGLKELPGISDASCPPSSIDRRTGSEELPAGLRLVNIVNFASSTRRPGRVCRNLFALEDFGRYDRNHRGPGDGMESLVSMFLAPGITALRSCSSFSSSDQKSRLQ